MKVPRFKRHLRRAQSGAQERERQPNHFTRRTHDAVSILELRLETPWSSVRQSDCPEQFDERIADRLNRAAVRVQGEARVDRHIVATPVESKAAALGNRERERIAQAAEHAIANEVERIARQCGSRITTCASPELDVVANGVCPM